MELTEHDMIHGIGRKATDEELIGYLEKGANAEPIEIEEAFANYRKSEVENPNSEIR